MSDGVGQHPGELRFVLKRGETAGVNENPSSRQRHGI